MKFVIRKQNLIDAINTTCKAVSFKNARPILTGIKFELNSNGLFLTGIDTDMSIVTKIPLRDENNNQIITIFEEGILLISARFVSDIVKGMTDDEITFEKVDENVVKITDSKSDFSLNCMDFEEYPYIDLSTQGATFTLPTKVLSNIISQVAFAASEKDGRAILKGINLKASQRKLECVATDSFRIARKTLKIDSDCVFNTTIPAKTLIEVGKIAETEDNVEITVAERKILFRFTNTIVDAKIINAAYPDTARLVPQTFTNIIEVKSVDFVSAVDRIAKLATDRNNVVLMVANHSSCVVSTKSQESGSGRIDVDFENYQGSELRVSYSARFVVEAIRALNCEKVEIRFNGEILPFAVVNKEDDSIIQLILPIKSN